MKKVNKNRKSQRNMEFYFNAICWNWIFRLILTPSLLLLRLHGTVSVTISETSKEKKRWTFNIFYQILWKSRFLLWLQNYTINNKMSGSDQCMQLHLLNIKTTCLGNIHEEQLVSTDEILCSFSKSLYSSNYLQIAFIARE